MSNACVITATNSSGQTAGTPVTIEAGGDVVLKAYGTGSGNWSATLAFAPWVGGVAQAPTTLTIGNNQPANKTSVISTGATTWVGWVVSSEGTWEASGIVEGFTDDEALAGDLGDFVGSLPTKGVKLNARASLNGSPVVWRGQGAGGWVADAQIEQFHPGDICIFGNSIIGQNGGGYALGLTSFYDSKGFCALGVIRTNGKARIVENLGVGGENSSALVARLNQLKRSPAGSVVVMESTNDATLGVSAASVFPNYLLIADACAASGKTCVMCTGVPRTTMTEALKTFYTELRDLIIANATGRYIVCDTYPTILAGDGTAVSGTLHDEIHPSATGALAISSPLVSVLNSIIPDRDVMRYPVSLGRNQISGQFFAGSGTTAPTGWGVQSAPTGGWTYVARPDSTGVLSAVASGNFILAQNIALTQVGRFIRGYLKMKVSNLNPSPAANSQQITFAVQCYNGSTFTTKAYAAYWDTGATYGNLALDGEIEFRTNAIEIPTGTTLVAVSISAGGGGGTYQLLHCYVGDDVE